MGKKIINKVIASMFWGIFICYVVFVLWTLLGRPNSDMGRSLNIVPFKSIMEGINVYDGIRYKLVDMQVWDNVVVFIPAGLYLMIFYQTKPIINSIVNIFFFSLCMEILQYIFNIGAADIDDVILNCLGGLIGIGIYLLLEKVLKTRDKTKTAVAAMSAVLGISFIIILIITFVVNFL